MELGALDYLGEPYLQGHSVLCKLLLVPIVNSQNDNEFPALVASLPEPIYTKLKERSTWQEISSLDDGLNSQGKGSAKRRKRKHYLMANYL